MRRTAGFFLRESAKRIFCIRMSIISKKKKKIHIPRLRFFLKAEKYSSLKKMSEKNELTMNLLVIIYIALK